MTEKIENTSREVKLVDDIGDLIPSACDNTSHALSWQEVNALADALEHAEYIEAVPALQYPWGQATHPLLTKYKRARLALEYAKNPAKVTIDPAPNSDAGYLRIQAQRETGGLRRAVELWARMHKAHQDFLAIKIINEKERTTAKRNATRKRNDARRARMGFSECDTTLRQLVIKDAAP